LYDVGRKFDNAILHDKIYHSPLPSACLASAGVVELCSTKTLTALQSVLILKAEVA
jgi:hypothetical protein